MTRLTAADKAEMDYSDNEVSVVEHSKLLAAISQLDSKQRVKPPIRKEPSLQVSEFHLVQSGEGRGNAVHLQDLAKALQSRGSHVQISRKLKAIRRKGRTLPKPLEKPEAERIQRSVGFKNLKQQVSRWDAIVQKNRVAEHQSFPLNQGSVQLENTNEFLTRFKSQSPLEAQVAEILNKSKVVQEEREAAKEEFPLSMEELAERRREMARLRAQQSYQEAKARRQGKIKSKKYHRVQRHERVRKQLRDFESLQKTDPEAALNQLQQLERTRAEERMTLRHRNTGQWARNRAIRAKYDPQSRQALAEQLAISRDLTQKVQQAADGSDKEDEDDNVAPKAGIQANSDNPWITVKPSAEMESFVSGYRQYWEKRNKEVAAGQNQTTRTEASANMEQNGSSTVDIVHIEHQFTEDKTNNKVELEQKEASSPNKRLKKTSVTVNVMDKEQHSTKDRPKNKNEVELEQKRTSSSKRPSKKLCAKLVNGKEKAKLTPAKPEIGVVVTGTSPSWVVTPMKSACNNEEMRLKTLVKIAANNKNIEQKYTKTVLKSAASNKSKKQKISETVFKSTANSKYIKQKDSETIGKNTANNQKSKIQTQAETNIEMDDLFGDMEKKLQQKVTKKLEKLKQDMRSNKGHHSQQQKEQEDMDIEGPSLALKVKAKRPQEDVKLMEEPGRGLQASRTGLPSIPVIPVVPAVTVNGRETTSGRQDDVDPNKFMSVKPKLLQTQFPDVVTGGDEGMDNEEEDQQMTITEAFTGDDVVAEFTQEKAEAAEKAKPQDVDLSLPGWGSWGGKNVPQSNRIKRRFIIKFPKEAPRRDDNKGHLIINEDKNTKILQHLVSELPFPFTTVKDFEASIRAPIGNTWVPETAHRKLIEPQVKTKLGVVIRPMDEEVLVNKGKKKKMEFV